MGIKEKVELYFEARYEIRSLNMDIISAFAVASNELEKIFSDNYKIIQPEQTETFTKQYRIIYNNCLILVYFSEHFPSLFKKTVLVNPEIADFIYNFCPTKLMELIENHNNNAAFLLIKMAEAELDYPVMEELCAIINDKTRVIKKCDITRLRNDCASYVTPCRTLSAYASEYPDSFKRSGISKDFLLNFSVAFRCISSEEYISEHNDFALSSKIDDADKLINPIEHNKYLDRQQLASIVRDSYTHLVLAGAGTGKTTAIIGLVKYLILSKKCGAHDILLITFTRATMTEMKKRLYSEMKSMFNVFTFHSLGMHIIGKVESKKPDVFDNNNFPNLMKKWLHEFMKDRAYRQMMCTFFSFYRNLNTVPYDSFKTYDEYHNFLKKNPPTTLNRIRVKSYGEMYIANFLISNKIDFLYEPAYKFDTATEYNRQYHPDFYLPIFDIYIEYYGIDNTGNVPQWFSADGGKDSSEKYNESIAWKRHIHETFGTRLIELSYGDKLNYMLFTKLYYGLKKFGVSLNPMDPFVSRFENHGTDSTEELSPIDSMVSFFCDTINRMRALNLTTKQILQINNETKKYENIPLICRLLDPLLTKYNDYLTEHNIIDFGDMIHKPIEYIRNGAYQHKYKYIIVDEYQDVSVSCLNLLNEMRCSAPFRLFCVGDDWQCIYGFNSSDIDYTLNFEKYWSDCDESCIETTHRFSQEMCDISGKFIMKNRAQKRKTLHSLRHCNSDCLEAIPQSHIISKLRNMPSGASVLFLGRYNTDIDDLSQLAVYDKSLIISHMNESTYELRLNDRNDLKMKFCSIHKSKGLEADYVFILGMREDNNPFPAVNSYSSIVNLMINDTETFPYAEERRLLYVALTRAKEKVWIVLDPDNISCFAEELNKIHDLHLDIFTTDS